MTTATVLQPIPFNTDRLIIFNVDLEEIDLDPSFPYTGFLSVTNYWRHPLEVELWPLPEGMSERELLSQGFYQTSVVLSSARLYVHHTQVAEFVEAQDLFDHSNHNLEAAKTVHYTAPFEMRALTPEIFLSFFGNEKPKPSNSKAINPFLVEPSKQILERSTRLNHLRESGFLAEVFRPHETLMVPLSHLDHTQLPCCLEVEAKSPSRILIFGSEGITYGYPYIWLLNELEEGGIRYLYQNNIWQIHWDSGRRHHGIAKRSSFNSLTDPSVLKYLLTDGPDCEIAEGFRKEFGLVFFTYWGCYPIGINTPLLRMWIFLAIIRSYRS